MENKVGKRGTVLFLLKCLFAAYLITAGMLLLLALLLFRFSLGEQVVSIGIIAIYIISTFVAGLIAGKRMNKKKFLWGLLVGSAYFLILLIVTILTESKLQGPFQHFITIFLMCTGSGMLGGMLG